MSKKSKKGKIIAIIVIIVALFIIIASSGNSKTSQSTNSTTNTKSDNAKSTPSGTPQELNALAQAQEYEQTSHLSKKGLYNQLTSQYGSNFTPKQAQYAINHLPQ
ncbi:Ltp family lipoprotein [uncultured Clostridium sp.]|uniref:Ltp family lipoprotein n=1 Tax=uncultured Clostridium sp. TaxID=59620 RepID=UPI00258725D4|nr:Ltp family lipoprotein [uncultured Clostridium sp.]